MKIEAIVAAAGSGSRLKRNISKPLIKIGNKPLIIRTLEALLKCSLTNHIIVATEAKQIKTIKRLIKKFRIKKIKAVIAGGKTRKDSVRKGLSLISETCNLVLVHDGARPFVSKSTILNLIKQANKTGAAIVGVPSKSTLKMIQCKKQPLVKTTVSRNNIWQIQTPQVFRGDIIKKAYKKFKNINATDDSSLVEKLGIKVAIIRGSYRNIKITTPEDLVFAEALLKERVDVKC